MRIAFITMEFVTESYYSGGVAQQFYRLIKQLISRGHNVHVITLSDVDQDFQFEDMVVHRVSLGWGKNPLTRLLPDTAKWLDFSFQAYRKLKELHEQNPFDLVQTTSSYACGLFTRLLTSIPVVVQISCHAPTLNKILGLSGLDIKIVEWLEWLQLRFSGNVFCPSHTTKNLFEKSGIKNIRVIPTPVYIEDIDWDYSISDDLLGRDYLLFFGRYQPIKGFHILAKALPRVFEVYPDCYAIMVGLDPLGMRDFMLEQCKGYEERLIFIGQIPHSRLYPIIDIAKFVVLPSLFDNFPNACLEAMALSVPVIGTIGASFDEIITDGINGFLVPANDVNALADKIVYAWNHPKLSLINYTAYLRSEDFAPEKVVPDILGYYQDILGGRLL